MVHLRVSLLIHGFVHPIARREYHNLFLFYACKFLSILLYFQSEDRSFVIPLSTVVFYLTLILKYSEVYTSTSFDPLEDLQIKFCVFFVTRRDVK